jgi:hypothetical protein
MSNDKKQDVITAYKDVAVPEAQEQSHPGLDKELKREWSTWSFSSNIALITAGIEYVKQEFWENGQPKLVDYIGSGKYVTFDLPPTLD